MKKIIRLIRWMNGEKTGPYSLEFWVDEGCNLFCKFCNPGKKKVKYLNFKSAFKILREAKQLNTKIVRVIGIGEPFLKNVLMLKFMEKIKQYNMCGYTVTNGTLFDEKNIKRLVEIGWDEIRISVHAPDATTHDYLVGESGAFGKVIYNINLFNKWKEKLKKKKPKLRIN